MARKKKIFTYEFADGSISIPASYQAKCTITGEVVPIYHKFFQRLIKKRYKNRLDVFLKTFKKKGAAKQQRQDAGISEEEHEQYKLNPYSTWLALSYKSLIENPPGEENTDARIKWQKEISYNKDCFQKHFNRDITTTYTQVLEA